MMPVDSIIPNLDWFITSDWTEPPATCKKATIVHDLAFKRFPETIDEKILSVMKKKLGYVKTESTVIFADSQATKTDLVQYYQIPEEKVVAQFPGVSPPITSSSITTGGIIVGKVVYPFSHLESFSIGLVHPQLLKDLP
jgi:hypothetical protein